MTLDEAIKHCEEVANDLSYKCTKSPINKETMQNCKCVKEHRQLAGWLKDYKRLLKESEK